MFKKNQVDLEDPLISDTNVDLESSKDIFNTNFLWKHVIAEFLGTTTLVFLGTCSAAFSLSFIEIAFAFGFGLMIASSLFAAASQGNGHFNPGVSLGYFLCRLGTKINPGEDNRAKQVYTFVYLIVSFIAQISGGIIGALLTKAVYNDVGVKAAVTVPSALATNQYNVVFAEFFGSIFLILFILIYKPHKGLGALSVGLCLVGLLLSFGGISGGGFNIARSLGTAIVANDYTNFWMYAVGQLTAPFAAAFFYYFTIPYSVIYKTVNAVKLKKNKTPKN